MTATGEIHNNRKNLLVLTSTFPRWHGDSEPRFIYDLCSRLSTHFNVIVLAPHAQGASTEESLGHMKVYRYRYAPAAWENLAYEGGIVTRLKQNKVSWALLPAFFLAQLFAIRKIIRQEQIDIIHAHWIIPQVMLALISRFMNRRKPAILCTSHGGDLFGLNDPVSKTIKRWVIKRVDAMTVVSNAMIARVAEISIEKSEQCTVIPMGTDLTNTFFPDPGKQRKPFQLLFVGRLVEKKGLSHLVKCMPSLLKDYPEIVLNIAGTGPEHEVIRSLAEQSGIADRINFLGSIGHQQLADLYRQSAMAIFPFVQATDGDMEGLGLVMVEALGCECPVIAGNVPAVNDVIEDEISGLLIDPQHEDAILQAVSRMLENQAQAREMATRGRQHVTRYFSWEYVTSRYIEILDKVGRS